MLCFVLFFLSLVSSWRLAGEHLGFLWRGLASAEPVVYSCFFGFFDFLFMFADEDFSLGDELFTEVVLACAAS